MAAFPAIALALGSPSSSAANYSDIWWNPSESGWGITIADHETQLFAVWYTYRQDGRPIWYVVPGGTLSSDKRSFHGDVYVTTGPPYTSSVFDSNLVTRRLVGSMGIDFAPPGMVEGTALVTYTIGNISQVKQLQRTPFGNAGPRWGGDFTDIYYNPAESGWGLALSQHGDDVFGVWYTYDTDGEPLWFVLPGVTFRGSNSFSGTLYRTTGPYFATVPFNSGLVTRTVVGTATIDFSATSAGMARFLTRPPLSSAPKELCSGVSAVFTPMIGSYWRAMPACVTPFGNSPIVTPTPPGAYNPKDCSGPMSATVTGFYLELTGGYNLVERRLDQQIATRVLIRGVDWTQPGRQEATIEAPVGNWMPGHGDPWKYDSEISVTLERDAIGTMVGSGQVTFPLSNGQAMVEVYDAIDFRVPGGINVSGHLSHHVVGGANGITMIEYQWSGSFSCIPPH